MCQQAAVRQCVYIDHYTAFFFYLLNAFIDDNGNQHALIHLFTHGTVNVKRDITDLVFIDLITAAFINDLAALSGYLILLRI